MLVNKHEIRILFIANFTSINDVEFFLKYDDKKIPLAKDSHVSSHVGEVSLHSEEEIPLGRDYFILSSEDEIVDVDLDEYVASEEFDEDYYYDGKDLGCSYARDGSTFKLWSPLASKVMLKIEKGDNSFVLYEMKREDRGVYSIKVKGDLFAKKYAYMVRINGREKQINDPYGKSVSVNSEYSVVVDPSIIDKLGKVKLKTPFKNYNEAVIYELHIRDFTEGLKRENSGTYLGLLDKADYLQDLGITHVQILPVLDSAKVDDILRDTYNWGYDPISFFALEGSYSSCPEDAHARMIEFKTMVNELHKRDIRVVLDVVYNHIYDYMSNDLQKNVPYYYFRKVKNRVSNASGCGNDIASERKMARKIIVDSIAYLLNTYDVDGFRFDLMGLLDVETMNEVASVAKKIKPDVILYGEGWDMGTLPEECRASSNNSEKLPDYAFFNDAYRDLIKGPTFNRAEKGYISGNLDHKTEVEHALLGSVLSGRHSTANQSLNYVECHDNQTLYDKLANIYDDKEVILRQVKFANALTMISLGIPFIHMGQEIGLSKFGIDNSYNVKHVNNMDWNLVEERKDMVNYMKDLIKIRKEHQLFHITDAKDVEIIFDYFQLDSGILTATIRNPKYIAGHKKVLFIFNPLEKAIPVEFDDYFQLYFSVAGLIGKEMKVKNFIAAPNSLTIFTLD